MFPTPSSVIAVDATEQPAYAGDAWYTISGINLEGKPTQKGVYINKGIIRSSIPVKTTKNYEIINE